MSLSHSFPITVYYEDTDAAGVVYYANYLKFAERARTEWLRSAGVNQSLLWQEHGLGFVVRRCEADYHLPARLDDRLTLESSLHEWHGTGMTMRQLVQRGDEVLVTLLVRIACVSSQMKPVRLPKEIVAALSR